VLLPFDGEINKKKGILDLLCCQMG